MTANAPLVYGILTSTLTTPRPARRRMAQPATGATTDSAALAASARNDAGHATLWDAAPINAPALPDDAPRTIVRDSLYDTIPLGALGLDLIGTPEFVRLQGIKQLGFVYRVWPGATHTRFEHSLGVYYLMLRGAARACAQARASDRARRDRSADDAGGGAAARHRALSLLARHRGAGVPDRATRAGGRAAHHESAVAAALERHGLSPARVAVPRGSAA